MVDLSVRLMTPRDQKETLTKKFTLEISKTQCFINTSEELKGYNLWKYKKKTIIPNLILLSSLWARLRLGVWVIRLYWRHSSEANSQWIFMCKLIISWSKYDDGKNAIPLWLEIAVLFREWGGWGTKAEDCE